MCLNRCIFLMCNLFIFLHFTVDILCSDWSTNDTVWPSTSDPNWHDPCTTGTKACSVCQHSHIRSQQKSSNNRCIFRRRAWAGGRGRGRGHLHGNQWVAMGMWCLAVCHRWSHVHERVVPSYDRIWGSSIEGTSTCTFKAYFLTDLLLINKFVSVPYILDFSPVMLTHQIFIRKLGTIPMSLSCFLLVGFIHLFMMPYLITQERD